MLRFASALTLAARRALAAGTAAGKAAGKAAGSAAGSAAGTRCAGAAAATAPGTRAALYYQGPGVPTSLVSTGKVGTIRDGTGSDGEFFGVDPIATQVDIHNGRGKEFSLDANGFKLVEHAWRHIDYYNNEAVLDEYYKECEALVCKETGAKFALAFDHNVRARSRKEAGLELLGGNSVQEPLISYGVHNDYTVTSAPARIRQLALPPKNNDTLRRSCGDTPPIAPERLESLLQGRWLFINVWRNITTRPVQRFPLAMCDAASMSADEFVVFEIRYSDRVGENYFARHSPAHTWYFFPEATRDEAVLLKCWDSRGSTFERFMPGAGAAGAGQRAEGGSERTVPATFSLHSGFDDPATPASAPDRESIEVRIVAFFADA